MNINSEMDTDEEFCYDFFKEAYYFQLDSLEKLRERISFLGGHLLLLGGGVTYLPLSYRSLGGCFFDLWFCVMVAVALGVYLYSVSLTLYTLARGFRYAFITPPLELFQYIEDLSEWNKKVAQPNKKSIPSEIKSLLTKQFAKCADNNFHINTSRGDRLLVATRSAIISSFFLLLAVPVFVISELQEKPESAISVKIIDSVRLAP